MTTEARETGKFNELNEQTHVHTGSQNQGQEEQDHEHTDGQTQEERDADTARRSASAERISALESEAIERERLLNDAMANLEAMQRQLEKVSGKQPAYEADGGNPRRRLRRVIERSEEKDEGETDEDYDEYMRQSREHDRQHRIFRILPERQDRSLSG